jgi:hypothetical protein
MSPPDGTRFHAVFLAIIKISPCFIQSVVSEPLLVPGLIYVGLKIIVRIKVGEITVTN